MSGYRRSFPKGTSERMCALMSEARNISELKRAQCIYFRSEHGLPPQQIADMVGFDVGTARNLHSAFLRDGEAALKLSGKGGRYHAYLTEEEEASWLEGFRDAGENGGILEVGRIQAAFEEKVGRKVAKSTVYDLLHRHPGYRRRQPPKRPKLAPFTDIIDRILEEDRLAASHETDRGANRRHTLFTKRLVDALNRHRVGDDLAALDNIGGRDRACLVFRGRQGDVCNRFGAGATRTPRPAAGDPSDAFAGQTGDTPDNTANARTVLNALHDHSFRRMHFAGDKVLERLLPALLDRFHGRLHSDAAEHASYTLSTEALYGLGDYANAWKRDASQ